MFNSREIAYLLWGTTAISIALFSRSMRISILSLFRTFFAKQLLYIYLGSSIYIAICITAFYSLGLWELSLAKDTVSWAFFVGFPMMYRAFQVNSFKKFKNDIIRPLVALSVVFEFVFGLYTFSLITEIVMVPVLLSIIGTSTYSKREDKYIKVYRFATKVLLLVYLYVGLIVLIHLYNNHEEYLNRLTLLQLVVPLLLSFLFLPPLYSLAMYIHYENTFIVMKNHFIDHSVYRYSIIAAMMRFNTDLIGLQRWKHMVLTKNMQSNSEILNGINLIKSLKRSERDPHTVSEALGWSPYLVKDLLIPRGIETGYYNNNLGDEFLAISSPFRLNSREILSDTITYMVLGKRAIATQLHLSLNVYHSGDNSTSHIEFLYCSAAIYQGVLDEMLPGEIEMAILMGNSFIYLNKLTELSVKKEIWPNSNMGYSLDFKITHNKHTVN